MTVIENDTVVVLSSPGSGMLRLGKYNIISGAKLWEQTMEKTGYIYTGGFQQTKEGGYIYATDFNLVKTDHQGNVIWKTPQASSDIAGIVETEDGGYIVTRSWYSRESLISKVAADGRLEWEKVIYRNEQAITRAILKSTSNEFVVVGSIQNSQSSERDILVIKFDARGNQLWRRTLNIARDDEALAIAEAANGDFVISGFAQDYETKLKQGVLVRLDSSGQTVWSKVMGDTKAEKKITFIEPDGDEGFIILENSEQPYVEHVHKAKIDNAGTVISKEKLEGKSTSTRTTAFYLKNTSIRQVAVSKSYEGSISCLVIYTSDGASCNIQTAITSSSSLDLCPGGTVTLSTGEGFATYKWNTGQTTRTITVSQAGQYKVEVTNEIGCAFATEAVTVTVKKPFAGDQICYVTVDKDTGKNKIIWNKTPDQNTASYNIYKRAVGGSVKVASVAFNAAPNALDNNSQPDSKTESYFVRAVDGCGNESTLDTEHRTVLLQASIGTSGEVNLNWNRYTGAVALKTVIYRGRDNNSLAPIAELTGQEDRYIDRNPAAEEKIYQVGIELDVECGTEVPNGRVSAPAASALTRSNTLNLLVAGLDDDYESGSRLILVWPNPVAEQATIIVDADQPQPVRLQLLDITGRFVRQETISSHKMILNRNGLAAGIYTVAVTLKNGSTLKKKIILK